MKKILLIICFLLFFKFSYAQHKPQIPKDKKLHFIAGAGISAGTYLITYGITKNQKKALIFSLISGNAAGILKEVYDAYSEKHEADFYDIVATTAGSGVTSVGFHLTFHLAQN